MHVLAYDLLPITHNIEAARINSFAALDSELPEPDSAGVSASKGD